MKKADQVNTGTNSGRVIVLAAADVDVDKCECHCEISVFARSKKEVDELYDKM